MDGKDFWEITGGVLCPCPAFWFVCFPLQMQQLSIVSESKSRENLFFFPSGKFGKTPRIRLTELPPDIGREGQHFSVSSLHSGS